MNTEVKARRTAKGNIKVTLTTRQARLLTELLGPSHGSVGHDIYGPLHALVGYTGVFAERLRGQINTDLTPG